MALQQILNMNVGKQSLENTLLKNSQLPTLSRTSPSTIELIRQYGQSPNNLLTVYNPSMQVKYCRDVDRVFFGKAPKLRILAEAYGQHIAESWLTIQLNDLSEFAGCKGKLSKRQYEELAKMILETYPNYNLAEFMLFCHRFKLCRYGRFYGAVDPMVILQSLDKFNEEREQAHYEHQRTENRKQQEESERELQAERRRYIERIPDAFTDKAPINFVQYRLMGFATMSDEQLQREIADIRCGRKVLPTDVMDILKIFND